MSWCAAIGEVQAGIRIDNLEGTAAVTTAKKVGSKVSVLVVVYTAVCITHTFRIVELKCAEREHVPHLMQVGIIRVGVFAQRGGRFERYDSDSGLPI